MHVCPSYCPASEHLPQQKVFTKSMGFWFDFFAGAGVGNKSRDKCGKQACFWRSAPGMGPMLGTAPGGLSNLGVFSSGTPWPERKPLT